MKKTLLLTAITLLLFSCSNKELDRGNAFDIIKEFYEYPNVEVINFQGVTSSQRLNKEYNNLRGQKFITERRKGKYSNEFWVFMTEKGKAFTLSETEKASYNGYKVASSVLELDEVTGIRFNDGKNTAYIDYNLKRTNVTPFGNSKDYNDGDILKKETVMQLYDDGWRITSSKPDIVKIENVKGFNKDYLNNLSKISREITNETSQSSCYINNVFEKYGETFITVDYIVLKWGTDKDGMDTVEIINNNKKLRTFLVNSNTKFPQPYLKIKDLKKYIIDNKKEYNQDFKITVVSGIATEIYLNDAG